MSEPATPPTPAPSRLSRIASVYLAVGSSVGWLVLLWVLVSTVPRFVEIFEKFDIPARPLLTGVIITASQAVQQYWYLFGALWLVAAAGLVVASALAKSRGAVRLMLACGAASAALVGVVIGTVVYGLQMPFWP